VMRGKSANAEGAALFSRISSIASKFLPIRRIVDTIYFAGKDDAILLQLADACAFIIRYYLERKQNVEEFIDVLNKNHTASSVFREQMHQDAMGRGVLQYDLMLPPLADPTEMGER